MLEALILLEALREILRPVWYACWFLKLLWEKLYWALRPQPRHLVANFAYRRNIRWLIAMVHAGWRLDARWQSFRWAVGDRVFKATYQLRPPCPRCGHPMVQLYTCYTCELIDRGVLSA